MQPYYDHAGITIYHADCRDVLPTLGTVDAIITDPPYGTTACAWDTPIPFDFMWAQLKRLTGPHSPIVLFGSQPFTSALVMSNPGMFKYSWAWDKRTATGGMTAKYQPMKAHEDVLVFASEPTIYNPQMVQRSHEEMRRDSKGSYLVSMSKLYSDVTYIKQSQRGQVLKHPTTMLRIDGLNRTCHERTGHPTQKPVALMSYLVKTYTNEGDTVLDFTMGSGTTLRAAKDLGRKAIGIEIEERYCEIAARRLSQEVFSFE